MRPIKFRAWDPIKGEMRTQDRWTFEFVGSESELEMMDDDSTIRPLPEGLVLMEFTGLKDKNGVDIYEGDVVEHENLDGTLGVVTHRHAGFSVKETGRYHGTWSALNDTGWTVIGNIHEHPHLLESKAA